MKVRCYVAPDMRTALAAARREQGGDVIIVGQRRVEGGLELITAEQYDAALLTAFAPRSRAAPRSAAEPAVTVTPDLRPAGAVAGATAKEPVAQARAAGANGTREVGTARSETLWTREPVIEQMRKELRSLRGLLHNQLASLAWTDLRYRHPLWPYLLRRAVSAGIAPRLAHDLVQRVPDSLSFDQGWRDMAALLVRLLRVTDDDLMARGGAAVLLGATGVGKTTLVCKLAAQFALRHGNNAVAVIAADSLRIAAQEQLQSIGRSMGITVLAVAGVEQLLPAVEGLNERKLVLIDTAGMGCPDRNLQPTLAALKDCAPRVKPYVVASAASQRRDLQRIFERYAPVSPSGVMLTKLDETALLGTALSAAILCRLPVAYVSAGQRIPEDCEAADAGTLVQRALAEDAADDQVDNSEVDLMLENLFSEEDQSRARA